MTPELVVWVLIAGLIGLVWVFTCAILTKDRPAEASGSVDDEPDHEQGQPQRSERRIAA
jgi:hypothetical protein